MTFGTPGNVKLPTVDAETNAADSELRIRA